jgi:hypothetical protein
MPYTDGIEISNKGLRFVQISGKQLIFAYEDGRTISVIFTSTRKANDAYNNNRFVDPNSPPTTFDLDGIESVEYNT